MGTERSRQPLRAGALVVVALAFSGCAAANEEETPKHQVYYSIRVAPHEASGPSLDWNRIEDKNRLAQVSDALENASNSPQRRAFFSASKEAGEAEMGIIHDEWRRQQGPTPPDPVPVTYEGHVFDVSLVSAVSWG